MIPYWITFTSGLFGYFGGILYGIYFEQSLSGVYITLSGFVGLIVCVVPSMIIIKIIHIRDDRNWYKLHSQPSVQK